MLARKKLLYFLNSAELNHFSLVKHDSQANPPELTAPRVRDLGASRGSKHVPDDLQVLQNLVATKQGIDNFLEHWVPKPLPWQHFQFHFLKDYALQKGGLRRVALGALHVVVM